MRQLRVQGLWNFLIAALVAMVMTVGVWLAIGPVALTRSVQFTLAAKTAGPKWSLEWQDAGGKPINGVWLDVARDDAGAAHVLVMQSVPNYRFSYLALRWWDAPGTVLSDPSPLRMEERVLWFHSEPELHETTSSIPGTVIGHDTYSSTKPDGGVVWIMPRWTAGQLVDLAFLYVVFLLGVVLVWRLYMLGGRRFVYNPEYAALLVVIAVNVWLAIRSPMLYCPDSMDYTVNALRFVEKPSMDHFNAWRLPGYSLFLWPFLKALVHYNIALGWAQGVMGVLTAWLASRITREFLSQPWAALTLLVVGLDPVLHNWTRHAMPEALCAFLAAFITWAVVQRECWARAWLLWALLAAVGVGAAGAALCYVRANYQVLAVLVPFAAGAWAWVDGQRLRASGIAVLALAATVGGLSPWLVHNYHREGKAEVVIGTGYTQALSLLEARAFDKNQSGAFTFEQWQQLRAIDPRSAGTDETFEGLRTAKGVPIADRVGVKPLVASIDGRAAAVARESVARHPGLRWRTSGQASLHLLGLWDPPETSENYLWSAPMRGPANEGLNQPNKPADYRSLPAREVQVIYDRTLDDIARWQQSGEAAAFDGLYSAAATVRPLWAGLFLIGVASALMRRQWNLLIIALIPLAHAAVLSVYLMDGIDRYQAPLYPLMSVVGCYAIAAIGGALGRGVDQRPRSGESR